MRRAHHYDEPRRPYEWHPVDCSCCSDDEGRLDTLAVAVRMIVGLPIGVLIAMILSALSGVPVL